MREKTISRYSPFQSAQLGFKIWGNYSIYRLPTFTKNQTLSASISNNSIHGKLKLITFSLLVVTGTKIVMRPRQRFYGYPLKKCDKSFLKTINMIFKQSNEHLHNIISINLNYPKQVINKK
jgi:hypothetical protein